MKRSVLFFSALVAVSCKSDPDPDPATVNPTSTSTSTPTSTSPSAPTAIATATATATEVARRPPGMRTEWVTFTGKATPIHIDSCTQIIVAMVHGSVKLAGQLLAETDTLVATRPRTVHGEGEGVAVVVHVLLDADECDGDAGALPPKVVRGAKTPKLTWARGAMSAYLDVTPDLSKTVYVGRLAGTAPVAEHVHATSWEILFADEAAGTFTLDGNERRLGPHEIVTVPPNTKHAWMPDPGSTLRAIQIYSPRGPEERFKALAAGDADAGAKK